MVNFLAFWDPVAGIFKSVGSGLLGALLSGLRLLFYFFAEYIYKAMVLLYDVFNVLCSTRLLDNDILDVLSARVGIVLGLFMLFYVIFSFIKMLIDPDQITDKSKGAVGIVKKILIVIVMLGVSSFCFRSLFSLQAAIVENHVVSKLFLPFNPDDSNHLNDKFGNILSAELFFSFYHVSDRFYQPGTTDLTTDWESNSSVVYCNALTWTLKDEIYENNDFSLGYACLNESVDIQKQSVQGQNTEATIIDFNWLFAVGIGIAVDYFLLSYCIAVGVRMIKLAVLEIISPMAFISYLSPKQDTMFSKWIKTYFSTYLDVFIRIGIINFAAFLCITIMDTQGDWEFWAHLGNQTTSFKYIIGALMIVALLSFAKKAPDLLKDLGFNGGNFGGFSFKKDTGLNISGFGAVTGAVGGVAGSLVNGGGIITGALRGGAKGLTGGKAIGLGAGYGSGKSGALRDRKRLAEGGSLFVLPGAQRRADRADAEKANIEAENTYYNAVSGEIDKIKKRALDKIEEGDFTSKNTTQYVAAKQRVEALREKAKNMDKATANSMTRSDFSSRAEYRAYLREQARGADYAYKFVQNQLANEVATEQANVQKLETAAISDFVAARRTSDGVVSGALTNIDAYERSKPSSVTFSVNQHDWSTLDSSNKDAKGRVTANAARLTDNATQGRRARADAKYSGNGK